MKRTFGARQETKLEGMLRPIYFPALTFMDVKTGELFQMTKGSIRRREGLLYCNVRVPGETRTERRPCSTGAAIICRDERVERRLMSLANADSTRRWVKQMPIGTRPHFTRTELGWMWLAAEQPRRWQQILKSAGLKGEDREWREAVGLSTFDRRWFVRAGQ